MGKRAERNKDMKWPAEIKLKKIIFHSTKEEKQTDSWKGEGQR
jgi:hypothetical protein